MTDEQYDRLFILRQLIMMNGITRMSPAELEEYAYLLSLSLAGKGNHIQLNNTTCLI
jgi:hypothetical protein